MIKFEIVKLILIWYAMNVQKIIYKTRTYILQIFFKISMLQNLNLLTFYTNFLIQFLQQKIVNQFKLKIVQNIKMLSLVLVVKMDSFWIKVNVQKIHFQKLKIVFCTKVMINVYNVYLVFIQNKKSIVNLFLKIQLQKIVLQLLLLNVLFVKMVIIYNLINAI